MATTAYNAPNLYEDAALPVHPRSVGGAIRSANRKSSFDLDEPKIVGGLP
jgi:hypothetical protein